MSVKPVARKSGRDRVFEAAVVLFAERGYRETTVGDIEAAAGLTPRAGGFYRHFKSKEDVLEQAIVAMSRELISELRLGDVITLKSPRAELLVIARALIEHAAQYRPLRRILQRDPQLSVGVMRAAKEANESLASQDLLPWVRNVLKRSGRSPRQARALTLIIFGPVIAYIFGLDRATPPLGLTEAGFLDVWAEHWTRWLSHNDQAL
jgi:AcrR family transcriptional regulator